jgi:hypothetical protein
VHILDAELGVGRSSIIILYDGVAYIDGIAGLDMVKEISHIEGDGRDMMVRMGLLDKFELEMSSLCAYLSSHSVVINIFGKEYRS